MGKIIAVAFVVAVPLAPVHPPKPAVDAAQGFIPGRMAIIAFVTRAQRW